MRQFVIVSAASLMVACAPTAPRTYATTVDQPVAAVREALLAIKGDTLTDEFRLPAATAGLGSDGQVVWNVYVGENLAGQLQIKLSSKGAGQTVIAASYAPANLSAADRSVLSLRDPKTLADILFNALDAQMTALNPQNSPGVVRRNSALAEEFLRAARIAANPTVIPENVNQAFEQTSKMLEESTSSSEYATDDAATGSSVPNDMPPASPAKAQPSDWKYGEPVKTPD